MTPAENSQKPDDFACTGGMIRTRVIPMISDEKSAENGQSTPGFAADTALAIRDRLLATPWQDRVSMRNYIPGPASWSHVNAGGGRLSGECGAPGECGDCASGCSLGAVGRDMGDAAERAKARSARLITPVEGVQIGASILLTGFFWWQAAWSWWAWSMTAAVAAYLAGVVWLVRARFEYRRVLQGMGDAL